MLRSFALPIAAGVCALLPGVAFAQAGMPTPPPGAQEKFMELQTLKNDLDGTRAKVMKNAKVKQAGDDIQGIIEARMIKQDPTVKQKLTRFKKLQSDLQAAALAKDRAKGMKLLPEIEKLGQTLNAMQSKIMADKDLEPKLKKFNALVQAEMKKIDPKIEIKLKRFEQLLGELSKMMPMGGAPPPGAGPRFPPPGK